MVSVLNRKLLRDAMHAWGLLATISAIMALGIMCFIYMRSSYFNLLLAQNQYYAQGRMADFWVDLKKAPRGEFLELLDIPGVTEIQPRIQFAATVDLENVRKPLNGLVISLPDRRREIINDIVLRRGSYFTEERHNQVVVNDAFARARDIHPGDTVHLLLNNRRQELVVVGTAISCEFVYLLPPGGLAPDPQHFGVFYLKESFAEEVFDFDGAANQAVGRLAVQWRDQPDALLADIERTLEPHGVTNVTALKNQPSNRFISDEIQGLGTFSTIMPAIFLTVGALVLNVLMMRLVDQQRVVIGTLKALGYGNVEIFAHFLKLGLIVGLIGAGLGEVLGYFMATWVTAIYRRFYEFPALENYVYPGVYLTGFAISFTCALVGCVTGCRRAVKLRPADAMRTATPAKGGAIWLERIRWLWRQLSFGWRMALRGLFRNRRRTAVGLFSSMTGAALLMSGLMMMQAARYLIDFQYDYILRSDIDLTFKNEVGREALLEARHLPGVDHAEPLLAVSCTFIHGPYQRKGNVLGLQPQARLTVPRDIDGVALRVPETGLMMSRKLAELLHAEPGDLITMRPTRGLQKAVRVPLLKVSEEFLGMSVYADITYLSRLISEEFAVSGVQLEVTPEPDIQTAFYRELKRLPVVQAVNAREDVIHNLEETVLKVQDTFIGLLILFAGVIFFGSVLNASLINLAERRREVATLRVLGYTERQIGGFFLRESAVVNLCGTLLGLPLGYFLAYLVSVSYDTEMFRFPVVSPPFVWVVTVVTGVGFGLLAHLVVERQIRRMNWLEALQVKE